MPRNQLGRRWQTVLGAAALSAALGASCARAQDESCAACHADPAMKAPQAPVGRLKASAHKDLGCIPCHVGKESYPHQKGGPRTSCDPCHLKSAGAVYYSNHGETLVKTLSGAALCLACHDGSHSIRKTSDPASSVNRVNIPKTCDRCHAKLDFKAKFAMESYASYARTVHGRISLGKKNLKAAVCTDCHGGHLIFFTNDSDSGTHRFNIPKTCGRCHPESFAAYSRSIHGARSAANLKEAPVCTDCHGEHSIQAHGGPGSTVAKAAIVKTCSQCHGSEKLIAKFGMALDPAKSYMDSYHGVSFAAGNLRAAGCASCHRYHDVLPSSDPGSSVYPGNLQKTCGACHPRAGDLVRLGKVHLALAQPARDPHERILRMARLIYLWIIALTIGSMLLHNLLDHKRKLLLGCSGLHEGDEPRLSRNERLQHFVLAGSFILLAYTGFCYAYPESLGAAVFKSASGAAVRSALHRISALVFILLAAYHVAWAAATREGRGEILAMLPRLRDFADFLQMQRLNLLHRGAPPKFGRFSYMEKAEYWALVWGSLVMIATGMVLWLREISLQHLPKWIIDLCLLIHFMEAALACLAIAVWHFYWTIFDAEVYPMSWAWLTGKVRGPKR